MPSTARSAAGQISVIAPVLNEAGRLGPCLDGLMAQGSEVAEILVVDGGSGDGTAGVVREAAGRDARVRLIEAGVAPAGWNGKVHNLAVGLARVAPGVGWVLTIDADVRPESGLAAALVGFAAREGVAALSVATRQRLSGAAEGVLHPALLTTLVYRFGIPGSATDRVDRVQANGQCFLVRRDALAAVGGVAPLWGSLCEDVTLARGLAAAGYRVGFYETEGLVSVAMYAGWLDAWRNWTRSLPMRDRYFGVSGWVGLVEIGLVQAAPLALVVGLGVAWLGRREGRDRVERLGDVQHATLPVGAARRGWSGSPERRLPLATPSARDEPPVPQMGGQPGFLSEWGGGGDGAPRSAGAVGDAKRRGWRGSATTPGRPSNLRRSAGIGDRLVVALARVNVVLLAMRLGVLVGTARAYERAPWTYWLSPLCDGPAVGGVWLAAMRRRHEWRGRTVFRGGPE